MTSQPDDPARIGRYDVIRKLAVGGMAELFLGRFVGPGGFEKRCAIKRILPQFALDAAFTRMFLNEARIAAMFDHPNLVQIFDLGQDERGQFFIAMEFVNGMSLRQLLEMHEELGARVPPELGAWIAAQALDGLAYAHAFRTDDGHPMNLVHRDVSPQNILISYEGAVKVVDFGIVKGASTTGETQSGMIKGKIAYMSPEQARGDTLDARSDLFALGICLYELITGTRPFVAKTDVMTLKAILDEKPVPLEDIVPTCPPGISAAVARALEKHPDARFENARAFQRALQRPLSECHDPVGRAVLHEYLDHLTRNDLRSFDVARFRSDRTTRRPEEATTGSGRMWRGDPSEAESSSETPARSGSDTRFERQTPAVMTEITLERGRAMDDGTRDSEMPVDASARWPRIAFVLAAAALTGAAGALLLRTSGFLDPPPVVAVSLRDPRGPSDVEHHVIAGDIEHHVVAPAAHTDTPTVSSDAPQIPRPVPATAAPSTKKSTKGRVRIESDPPGLQAFHAGKKLGTTPTTIELPAGSQAIELRSTSLGIQRKLTIEITSGALVDKRVVVQQGSLSVLSRPYGELSIDGVHRGLTPFHGTLHEGTHEIRVVAPDGTTETRFVELKANAEKTVKIVF